MILNKINNEEFYNTQKSKSNQFISQQNHTFWRQSQSKQRSFRLTLKQLLNAQSKIDQKPRICKIDDPNPNHKPLLTFHKIVKNKTANS